jgi:hypothetical protein
VIWGFVIGDSLAIRDLAMGDLLPIPRMTDKSTIINPQSPTNH